MSNDMENKPSSPETTKAEMLPNETFWQELKRLSKEGHPSGKFVDGTNLGPISVFSTPKYESKPGDNSKPETEQNPTTDDLLQAWKLGGMEKLRQMLRKAEPENED